MGKQRIKFRIFSGARQKRSLADTDSPTGYRDWIEYNIEAEALGYCSSFTTQNHIPGSARYRRRSICLPDSLKKQGPCASAPTSLP